MSSYSPIEQFCKHCGFGRRFDGTRVAALPGTVCCGHDIQYYSLGTAAAPAGEYLSYPPLSLLLIHSDEMKLLPLVTATGNPVGIMRAAATEGKCNFLFLFLFVH
jgi:hypothetical protein